MPVSRPLAPPPQEPTVDDVVERAAVVLHEAASTMVKDKKRFDELSDRLKHLYRVTAKNLIDGGHWNTDRK